MIIRSVLLLIWMISYGNLCCQNDLKSKTGGELLLDPIQIAPEFPGGDSSMWCHIESNINLKKINNKVASGRIFVLFTVDLYGKVKEIEVNPGSFVNREDAVQDDEFTHEIIDAFNKMPLWKPGEVGGTNADGKYAVTIKIPYLNFKCSSQNK